MNGLHNVHYHNSLLGLGNEGKYKPSTSIKTEQLTEKYTIKGNIGRGKFAVVRRCINNETGEEVAAKFIRKRRKGKSCRDEILREVVMLELALEHPRLVDLKEVFETQTELILITEYCAGGELFTECVIEESFSEQDVVRLLRQILEGLVYLHERNIVHLDLKPQNILLTKPFPVGDIKVCDLGFACLVNTGEDICDIIGTPDYVAPEVLSYEPLGLYTDMWSLGVLTYVMLTAHAPFTGKDNQETFLNISQVNLDFPEGLFGEISSASQDFIQKLLVKEPEDRLTAVQCLEHPWLTGIINPEKLLDVSSHEESESNVLTNEKIDDNELLTKEKEDVCEKLTEGPEAEKRTSPIFKKEITVEIESRSEVHCGIDISAVTQTTSDGDKENVEIIFNKSSNCSPSASAHIYTTQVDFIPSKISKCNVDNRSASEMGLHSPDKLTQCTASECISSNLKIDVSNDFNSNTSNLTLDVTSDI